MVSEQRDRPESIQIPPLRLSSDQSAVDLSDGAQSLNDTNSEECRINAAIDHLLEDMQINAAIDSLLGNATARSYSERVGHNTRPTHNNRFNDWQKKRREECRNLLKSAQVDANIRFGLYGVEVDLRVRLDDIDMFHAQFIPADMLKPRDWDNAGKQSEW